MKYCVCIIEDDKNWATFVFKTICDIIRETFPKQEFEFPNPVFCETYQDAVKAISENRFDIISCDIDLGNANKPEQKKPRNEEVDGRAIIKEIANKDRCNLLIVFSGIGQAEWTSIDQEPFLIDDDVRTIMNTNALFDNCLAWSKSAQDPSEEAFSKTLAAIRNKMGYESERERMSRLLFLTGTLIINGNPMKICLDPKGKVEFTCNKKKLKTVRNTWTIRWGKKVFFISEAAEFRLVVMIIAAQQPWRADQLWKIQTDKKESLFFQWLSKSTDLSSRQLLNNLPEEKRKAYFSQNQKNREAKELELTKGLPATSLKTNVEECEVDSLHSKTVASISAESRERGGLVTSLDGREMGRNELANSGLSERSKKYDNQEIEREKESVRALCDSIVDYVSDTARKKENLVNEDFIAYVSKGLGQFTTHNLKILRKQLKDLQKAQKNENWEKFGQISKLVSKSCQWIRQAPVREEKGSNISSQKKMIKSYISRNLRSMRATNQTGIQDLCDHLDECIKIQSTPEEMISYSPIELGTTWRILVQGVSE